MKKRSLLIMLLVMLAMVTSGFTYAFWAAGIASDSETATGSISIGTGETVSSTVNVSAAANSQGANELVPSGFEATGKISSLTLTFSVDWDSTGLDASGLTSTLTVALTGASNGTTAEDAAVLALINAAFNGAGDGTYSIISDGSAVSVVITITIDEPADVTEYNLIAGQDLTLTFSFSVAAANTPA